MLVQQSYRCRCRGNWPANGAVKRAVSILSLRVRVRSVAEQKLSHLNRTSCRVQWPDTVIILNLYVCPVLQQELYDCREASPGRQFKPTTQELAVHIRLGNLRLLLKHVLQQFEKLSMVRCGNSACFCAKLRIIACDLRHEPSKQPQLLGLHLGRRGFVDTPSNEDKNEACEPRRAPPHWPPPTPIRSMHGLHWLPGHNSLFWTSVAILALRRPYLARRRRQGQMEYVAPRGPRGPCRIGTGDLTHNAFDG